MKYIIVSGYFQQPGASWGPWFHRLWYRNLMKWADPKPERVFIISGSKPPLRRKGEWITLTGNLGHCDAILKWSKTAYMPACPATWMAGLWLAYLNECDFVYLEQDCLAFGPWVKRVYNDLGMPTTEDPYNWHGKKVAFATSIMHGAATSLFIVRHWYIPFFVKHYIESGAEDHINRIAEQKVFRMSGQWPEFYSQFSFGVDKERPLPFDNEVWFAQKFTANELRELENRKLVSCFGMPENVDLFSNHK